MTTLSPTDRVGWYKKMLEIRCFEEKIGEFFASRDVEGGPHVCSGQEAVSVGAMSAIRPDDVITTTYRGHGHALARGMTLDVAFAEMTGRRSGGSGGVGGSMHLVDFDLGHIGANAIVGAQLSIAVGAAAAFNMRDEDRVALTFCGDGATNIGTFHEAMNMASVWTAPVVFIVENNLYGEWSSIRETTPIEDLALRAEPYGIPGVIVDGQDADAVHAAVAQAVTRARAGDGPSLLEMKTYRFKGHSRDDACGYRPPGELERWMERDPITVLGARLIQEGLLTSDSAVDLARSARADIERSATNALATPYPTLEETFGYVYAV
jgi:acetoin:2,6-dichlorophenolindophenol oxidoreductase subunit alpha